MGKMKMNDLQLSDTDSESDEESKYSEFGLNVGIYGDQDGKWEREVKTCTCIYHIHFN